MTAFYISFGASIGVGALLCLWLRIRGLERAIIQWSDLVKKDITEIKDRAQAHEMHLQKLDKEQLHLLRSIVQNSDSIKFLEQKSEETDFRLDTLSAKIVVVAAPQSVE